MSDIIHSPISDVSSSDSSCTEGMSIEQEPQKTQPYIAFPAFPAYPEDTDLFNQSGPETMQPARKSISPPLIPGDRPSISQKRHKPQSANLKPPPNISIDSRNPFGIDDIDQIVQLRPPPLQMDGRNHILNSEGYLTPPLTSKFFSPQHPPAAVPGPFGGYTSPTMVPSDIVYVPCFSLIDEYVNRSTSTGIHAIRGSLPRRSTEYPTNPPRRP
jgi:hypothetical protein